MSPWVPSVPPSLGTSPGQVCLLFRKPRQDCPQPPAVITWSFTTPGELRLLTQCTTRHPPFKAPSQEDPGLQAMTLLAAAGTVAVALNRPRDVQLIFKVN